MSEITSLGQPLATFCGQPDCKKNCGCPELFIDPSAPTERRVVRTDDFGAQVRMSAGQFGDLVAQAKSGALDGLQA